MKPVPQAFENEVNHSFIGGEGANSNSEVDMPPKLMKVQDPETKPVQKKCKAPALAPTLVASSSHSAPRPHKETYKGKGVNVVTSRKRQCGAGASSVGTSPSTPTASPKLWASNLSIRELEWHLTVADTSWEHDKH